MPTTMPHDTVPQINAAHAPDRLRGTFDADGRIQIRDFLTAESARRLHQCLENETDYRLTFVGPNGSQRVKQDAVLSPEQMARMAGDIYQSARDEFQFLYDSRHISNEGEPYRDPAHYLARVTEFLNGPAFLDFARRVTGLEEIACVEAQATRYGRGHFLSTHDDDMAQNKRLAAYVLNMTPGWRADWGGVLMFPDAVGNIAGGYTPAFNALNIFRIPRFHMVSMVMPFAAGGRHAVTGWLRRR